MARPRKTQPKVEEEPISESYISIGLGILVVVVVGILLYNYITQRNAGTVPTPQEQEDKIAQEATTSAKPGTTYTVVAGDTLWSISEKSYGTGYNWQEIAKANNLDNSDQLSAGQQLVIPAVTPAPETGIASAMPIATPVVTPSPEIVSSPIATPVPVATPVATPAPEQPSLPGTTITGTSYTVVAGDTLWDISCRAYGDCYAWVKIAQSNQLLNPNLIHPGNVLTLPR